MNSGNWPIRLSLRIIMVSHYCKLCEIWRRLKHCEHYKSIYDLRKHVIPSQTHKVLSKDVLSNTKLNDTKTIEFSPENHLFYIANNSNSICQNRKNLYHRNAYKTLQAKGR